MNAPNVKILVVDDEGAVRAFLTTVIKGEGFNPLEARDGEQALEMVKSEAPDLMLLDMRLPDMNGIEVLRLARKRSQLSVIVLTGYSDTTGRSAR
jgi:two-component system response regulator (stage 0 sporulation protein F)